MATFVTCPKCGEWHSKPRGAVTLPVGTVCKCGHAFDKLKPTTTNAAWGTKGGRSLQFAFSDLAKTKRDLPSAEFDSTGSLVYRSEKHQKRVFAEMRAVKERVEREQAIKFEQDVREGRASRHHSSVIPDIFTRGLHN